MQINNHRFTPQEDRELAVFNPVGDDISTAGTATTALQNMGGFNVCKMPLHVQLDDGTYQDSSQVALVRQLEDHVTVLGTAAHGYDLIAPDEVTTAYDRYVESGEDVQVGLLGADTFYIRSHLPRFKVAGEDMAQFLYILSPMNGKHAARAFVTSVRLFCTNQLLGLLRETGMSGSVAHHDGSIDRLTGWMEFLYKSVEDFRKYQVGIFNRMAHTAFSDTQFEDSLLYLAKEPKKPFENSMPHSEFVRKLNSYETQLEKIGEDRDVLRALWQGEMTGFSQATKGTVWGALAAYSEFYNHSGRRQSNPVIRAQNVLNGPRGAKLTMAQKYLTNYVVNN